MNVTVNSVSKTDQKISQAPAAITVINHDQIERSGLTTIPDLLRLVPGMDVGRIDASTWAVSSRGFNNQFADKLLVLMDGRTIYDPLTAGVFWDQQDYVLTDLDKIEVIRGPGATLWGANAVNGVVNITTKSARDTQGLLIDGLAGTNESNGSVRYGGKIDSDTYYRVYGKFRDFSDFSDDTGANFNDGWRSTRGGFRIDRYPDSDTTFTLQGDIFHDVLTDTSMPGSSIISPDGSGGNVLARFTHDQSTEAGTSLQIYYDNATIPGEGGYHRDTIDLSYQQRAPIGSIQELTWGGGMRGERSSTDPSSARFLNGDISYDYILSAFAQDDITLVPERFHLVIGSKFEYSSYDRFQAQPGARLLFTPNERNTFWGAVSRALRSPSLDDRKEISAFGAIGAPGTISLGNPDLKPEELIAYEAGYRAQLSSALTFDAATFYNHYGRLTADGLRADGNTTILDAAHGWSTGIEVSADYRAAPNWRLEASYSYLFSSATPDPGTLLDNNNTVSESPHDQAQLHSYWDLTDHIEINSSIYFVEHSDAAPEYIRLDLGLNWRPCDHVELGIEGQNLLHHRHGEFSDFGSLSPVARNFYAHVRVTY